ncbi:MAG: ABC transporter substrate-binding protein [Lautropia sp.]
MSPSNAISVCRGLSALLLGACGLLLPAQASAQALAAQQVVRFGLGVDDIRTVDPQIATSVGESPIIEFVYESLARFPEGVIDPARIEPSLAESWSMTPDGRSWTFKLRKGVKWHGNHGDFTADDVIYSLDRLKDPKTASPFTANLGLIEKAEKIDDHTVRLTTKRPEANLPALLVGSNRAYVVSKAAVSAGVDLRTQPVGTGPFQVSEYRPRESFILVRNENYWQGKPIIERIVAQFMSNASTRELALRSGDVHAIEIAASQDVIERMRRAKMHVDLTVPANAFMLYFNPTIKPFDDIRVRRALSHAVDRRAMLKFMGDEVSIEETSPLPIGYLGHAKDVPSYPYDPAKAKSLLAEAGFPEGFSATLPVSNNNIYLPPMQIIQEQWRKLGVNLTLNVVDHPTYHRLIRQNVSPVVIYGAYRYPMDGIRYLDEFWLSSSIIGTPTAVTNFSHYRAVDSMLEAARTETDLGKRNGYWEQAQRKIMEDAMAVPLFTRTYAMARSPKLDVGHAQKSYTFYTLSKDSRLLR